MSCICRLELRAAPQQLVLPYEVSVEYSGARSFKNDKEDTIEIQLLASKSVYIGSFSPETEVLDDGEGALQGMHTFTEELVANTEMKSTALDLRVKYQPAQCTSESSGYSMVQLPSLTGCRVKRALLPVLACTISNQPAHDGRTHIFVPAGSLRDTQHVGATTAITMCTTSVLLLLLFSLV